MFDLLGLLFHFIGVLLICGDYIVRAEIERTQDIERDLAIEAETLEADRGYNIAVLVESADLRGEL